MAKDITKTMKKNPPLCRRFYCKYPMGKKLFKFNNERRNNGCTEVDSEPSQISKRNFFRENVSKKLHLRSSVIRQKGESQNGCFKKTKHVKFSEKRTFLTPWLAHVRGVLCFLGTPVLRLALLPYYRRDVRLDSECVSALDVIWITNSFQANDSILYPLKTSETPDVFWYFHGL